jgi:hypothetical protein
MGHLWFTLPLVCAVCLSASPVPDPEPSEPRTEPLPEVPLSLDDGPVTPAKLAALAKRDPVALLDACRRKYAAEVRGYRCTLVKRERINGTLFDEEEIRVAVRQQPFAVLMLWDRGSRDAELAGFKLGKIEGVLYAVGENRGNLIVWRPTASFLTQKQVDPTSDTPRASARFAVPESGQGHALERTYRSWSEGRENGTATVSYVETRAVPELGGRVCHVVRKETAKPELDPFLMSEPNPDAAKRPADAFSKVDVMIDAETGLQVGSVIRRADGELVASYFFRDVQLNPAFDKDQFKPAALKK